MRLSPFPPFPPTTACNGAGGDLGISGLFLVKNSLILVATA
jgi:hypothetical protein